MNNLLGKMEKRFQECSLVIKIFRYRWYLLIPFKWFYFMFLRSFKVYETEIDKKRGCVVDTGVIYNPRGKKLWSLLIGVAQGNMKWYYSSEEVFDNLERKLKKK